MLAPQPGEIAVDCTLGYGGHAQEILAKILPGGKLLGLDADPIELPKTEARLRALGFDETFSPRTAAISPACRRSLAAQEIAGADLILADLGVSSMQIDDPARGFSVKLDGPLDMRMNPQRGQPASAAAAKNHSRTRWRKCSGKCRRTARRRNWPLRWPGKSFRHHATTRRRHPRRAAAGWARRIADLTVRRVFQALRIAVNDEFSALETFLRNLPACLKPGGRVAILTFHSGEDRRVKKSFAGDYQNGIYSEISDEIIRPTPAEQHSNPRSAPAKLRWAIRSDGVVSA